MATTKKAPTNKPGAGRKGTVKAHTRRVNGKKVRVTQHNRRGLSPRRALRNAGRAVRAGRRKRHLAALGLGALAVGELAGWVTLRGTSIGLTCLGVGLVGIGLVARSLAR
jgi:hypothetical protein